MTTPSLQDYLRQAKKKKRNKYGAVKTRVDNILFDSKREAKRYQELKLLEKSGKISKLELQPTYDIDIDGIFICTVKLDFLYWDNILEDVTIEDSKGKDNPVSRLKRKLVEAQYGIKVELV